MTVEVRKLEGSGTVPFGVPFRNVYILNDGGKGWIRINDTLKLDIEKIDRVEGLTIKKLEWNLTSDGNAVFVILSHEKLSTEYITRLMLSRIYSELQTKSSKKKIVLVDASSSGTVPAGSSETITIQPPQGKIWRLSRVVFKANPPADATSGQHRVFLGVGSGDTEMLGQYASIYSSYLILRWNYVDVADYVKKPASLSELVQGYPPFDYSYPLVLTYQNNTDADQTATRTIKLLLIEEDEAT